MRTGLKHASGATLNDMADEHHWDEMYDRPAQAIPWEIAEPPKDLTDFLRTYGRRGSALDIGCGTGNYSVYLASAGFQEVLGVDFSAKAIEIARARVFKLRANVSFQQADVLELSACLGGKTFDFILDYSILHHISDEDSEKYAEQCYRALKPDGRLLLVCYTENNEFASGESGTGKYGNTMYFRTAEEIKDIYKNFSVLLYRQSHLGKRAQHEAHSFIFTRA